MVAKRGRGIVVEDVDAMSSSTFPRIAVTSTDIVIRKWSPHSEAGGELIHMSGTDFYYEGMVTLAERLSRIMPMPDRTRSITETPARKPSSAL